MDFEIKIWISFPIIILNIQGLIYSINNINYFNHKNRYL